MEKEYSLPPRVLGGLRKRTQEWGQGVINKDLVFLSMSQAQEHWMVPKQEVIKQPDGRVGNQRGLLDLSLGESR